MPYPVSFAFAGVTLGALLSSSAVWAQAPDAAAPSDPGAESPQTDDATAAPPAIVAPEVLTSVEATYPPEALRRRQEGEVILGVTVEENGTVRDATIVQSAGAALDEAALSAVRQWRFTPAQRDGQPVVSRIHVPFRFRLPEVNAEREEPVSTDAAPGKPQARTEPQLTPPRAAPAPGPPPPAATDPAATEAERPQLQVTVHGDREPRTENRSAADFHISRDVLHAGPRQEGVEVLRTAPGLYIGRGEGPAVAPRYMLRGFDADHGQDIEFRVGGVPINLPSHIHGQGYADLSFLIADVVDRLDVSEGVYDPRQGDFAVAGSIDVGLGVDPEQRGVTLRTSYGAFRTFRQLLLWAPPDAPKETFGAAQYMQTRGFGQNRAGRSGSALLQSRFGEGEWSYRVLAIGHTARFDHAGVLRQDDIDAGRVCYECVYSYPTAQAQNAHSQRLIFGAFADYAGAEGDFGQLGVWVGLDHWRLQENFTGFIQRSRTLEQVSGRGDLIEQRNHTASLGVSGYYRSRRWQPTEWLDGTLELGLDARLDRIEQAQNLLDASVRLQTWDQRVDSDISGFDFGVWGDLDWRLTRYLEVRLGVRADLLSYEVDDRLGNFAPLTRPQDAFIVGFRRSAAGVAWGPRASVTLQVTPSWSLLAAYGEGYRSPQARTLEDGDESPFTKVRSGDVGIHFDWAHWLHGTVAGYYTRLSDDVSFDAAEGRMERVGASERWGAVVHAYLRPLDWLVAAASLTFVDANLLQPPLATPEEPQPPFEAGQPLPYVPPWVLRADIGLRRELLEALGANPLSGHLGAGLSHLSARPLPYADEADPVTLLDLGAGVTWGPVDVALELFNVLDARYAAVAYHFASDWNPNDGVRPRTPARHIAAGSPRAWLVSVGLTL